VKKIAGHAECENITTKRSTQMSQMQQQHHYHQVIAVLTFVEAILWIAETKTALQCSICRILPSQMIVKQGTSYRPLQRTCCPACTVCPY
jgi:hypothetical protein